MAISTRKYTRYLFGASCAAALLAGTVGVLGAQALPPTTAQASRAAPHGDCTGYHYDENRNRVWDPPGCTPP